MTEQIRLAFHWLRHDGDPKEAIRMVTPMFQHLQSNPARVEHKARIFAGLLQAGRATNQPGKEKEYDNQLRNLVETVRSGTTRIASLQAIALAVARSVTVRMPARATTGELDDSPELGWSLALGREAFRVLLASASKDGSDGWSMGFSFADLFSLCGDEENANAALDWSLPRFLDIDRANWWAQGHAVRRIEDAATWAELFRRRGKLDQAEELAQDALAHARELPEGYGVSGLALRSLGRIRADRGDPVEGERLLREALANQRETKGPLHLGVGLTLLDLGAVLQQQDLLEESESVLRDANKILTVARGPYNRDTMEARRELGTCLAKQGRTDESRQVFAEIHRVLAYQFGASHPQTLQAKAMSEL